MAAHTSGMAASIRGATESDTFDLAGHGQANITQMMRDAFTEPLPLNEMIRITFITGAGKLGRQKYDENAAKAVSAALRNLGYEEDRAASCVVECGGTFKSQHDTGKNLKTVVVFPKITGPGDAGGLEEGVDGMNLVEGDSLLDEESPKHMIAMSSPAVFSRMLKSKCHSWSQKKGCLKSLEQIKLKVGELDTKLLNGSPLTYPEQELYDSVSMESLAEKESLVRKEMQMQVETGNITRVERETLLSQVAERLDTLDGELAEAKASNKQKKVEKLASMREKAVARQKMLEDNEPQPLHRLRNEPQIAKLRMELRPLQKLEDSAKGRLLSVKETTALGRKEEILEEIAELEEASREWFEEDDAFEARLEASRAAAKAKEKKKKSPVASGGGYKAKPVSSWVTPGAIRKKSSAKPAKGKSKIAGGGSVFAAMMMDSDSDSD